MCPRGCEGSNPSSPTYVRLPFGQPSQQLCIFWGTPPDPLGPPMVDELRSSSRYLCISPGGQPSGRGGSRPPFPLAPGPPGAGFARDPWDSLAPAECGGLNGLGLGACGSDVLVGNAGDAGGVVAGCGLVRRLFRLEMVLPGCGREAFRAMGRRSLGSGRGGPASWGLSPSGGARNGPGRR